VIPPRFDRHPGAASRQAGSPPGDRPAHVAERPGHRRTRPRGPPPPGHGAPRFGGWAPRRMPACARAGSRGWPPRRS